MEVETEEDARRSMTLLKRLSYYFLGTHSHDRSSLRYLNIMPTNLYDVLQVTVEATPEESKFSWSNHEPHLSG